MLSINHSFNKQSKNVQYFFVDHSSQLIIGLYCNFWYNCAGSWELGVFTKLKFDPCLLSDPFKKNQETISIYNCNFISSSRALEMQQEFLSRTKDLQEILASLNGFEQIQTDWTDLVLSNVLKHLPWNDFYR